MRRRLLAAAAVAAAAVAGVATAQEPPGSPLVTAGISQRFTADSNFRLDDPDPGASYFADTRVLLGLLSETPVQVFALGLDTGLRALWEAERDFDFTFASPSTARADWTRDWASGALDVGLRYRQTAVDADRPLADFIDPDTGEIDFPDDLDRLTTQITERRYDGTFDLELATDAPSSYVFSLAATRVDYDEVTNDTTPRTNVQGDALWRLRLTPVLSGALFGAYRYFDSENARDTLIREADVDVGVIYEPDEALRLDVGLGYADYDRRETRDAGTPNARRVSETETGPVARARLRYAIEAVTLAAEARYSQATDGAPFTGALSARYPLPRGALSGRVFQNKTGSSTGAEARVTGAGLGLSHEINALSALQFDFSAARQVDETAPFAPDITRFAFSAVYSRDLTETVAASLGYRFRSFDQDPDEATSNAVFFQIGRSFAARP
jgi:hypothetical protein